MERKGRSAKTINNYRQTYRHNVAPTLGSMAVTKVTTKTLTDLYGQHQQRGLSARSVYQIHATVSSMMTQACRWGWRDSNPAQWADPPTAPGAVPVVPSVEEVQQLIRAAEVSKRPEYARLILIAATTGLRRGELCALRYDRDIDLENRVLTVASSIVEIDGEGLSEAATKNRRTRLVAIDEHSAAAIAEQHQMMVDRAAEAGLTLVGDPFLFSDALDGSSPWRPTAKTSDSQTVQVAIRAGHDPAIATKHYTGKVDETDRELAAAVASLLVDPAS